MMKALKIFLRLLLVLPFFSACDIINPPEDVPSYLQIDSVSLETTVDEGSNSDNITDVWVSAEGQSVGVFELPAIFPVHATGTKEVVVQAGIKENGIANTRIIYPFFQPYRLTVDLEATKVDTLHPVFRYTPTTKFGFVEDFDGVAADFQASTRSVYLPTRTGDTALIFEGDSSLLVTFDATDKLFEIETKNTFALPRGKPIFLEMDFKCNVFVGVGIDAISPTEKVHLPLVVLNTTDVWKKIYIELGSIITGYESFYSFKIFINGQADAAGQQILLDNIKLLYLE